MQRTDEVDRNRAGRRGRVNWGKLGGMCGRYSMGDPRRCLAEFSVLERRPALEPRYNIAPSQGVWVVRVLGTGHERRLDLLRWGLVRRAGVAGGLAMVRSESLATRATFTAAFRSRRCLFLADGF